MRNLNANILSAVDTASANGAAVDSNQLIAASFQAHFGDATAVGVIKIQMSNDIDNNRYMAGQDSFVPTNWTDIPSATAAVSSGASVVISIPQMCYRWVRAVFTYTSGGSSTVNVNINALSL